jgi:uncharacterized protein (TIRG00374 family)
VATVTIITEGTLILLSILVPTLFVGGIAIVNGAPAFDGVGRLLILLLVAAILLTIFVWQWNAVSFSRFRIEQLQRIGRFWDRHIQPRWFKKLENWQSQQIVDRLRQLWIDTVFSVRYRSHAILACLVARFVFEALCLMICFYALGQRLSVITLLLVYSLTITINTLGAVPGGIGLAEVSLAAFYSRLGITSEVALAVALAYRLTGYWFPRLLGGLAWLWLERRELPESVPKSVP